MATAYLFCGLPASGKSTHARQLEATTGARRFTLDEIMLARYDYSIFDERYGAAVAVEKERIWREAQTLMDQGRDVILDWSLWNPARRRAWVTKIERAGHRYTLFYFDVSLETLKERLRARNEEPDPGRVHAIPLAEVERFATQFFQPPTPDEGLNVQVISHPR